MFRDARAIEDGSILDADVCIVGTGAAGASIAVGLAGSGLRVVVLEAGGERAEADVEALGALETPGLPIASSSRQRFFGGTTNTWWGKVALLDESDFAPREHVVGSGWPFGLDELLPYYQRACVLMGIPDLTRPTPSASHAGSTLGSGGLAVKAFYWPRKAPNFGDLYRRAVRSAANVSTILHANVTEIDFDEHGRADRLVVTSSSSRSFSVRPRVAILACGGIENARILLNSGLSAVNDTIGRYYMDHPRGHGGVIETTRSIAGLSAAYWSGKRAGSVRVRLGVGLTPEAQASEGVLNSYVNLTPDYEGGGVKAIRNLYRRGPGALKDGATARGLVTGLPAIARYLRFKRFGRGWVRTISVDNYMEQEPRAANRVTLSDRRDALGRPLARVEWSLSEQDRRSMRTLHATLAEELARRGMGLLRSPILEDDESFTAVNDAAHHLGGTRMGTSPRMSVVDGDSRVHGSSNLYIAGSSVFPTGGSANPTLTIVALAARLADTARESLQTPVTVGEGR